MSLAGWYAFDRRFGGNVFHDDGAVRTARLALIAGSDLTTAQIGDDVNWPAQP